MSLANADSQPEVTVMRRREPPYEAVNDQLIKVDSIKKSEIFLVKNRSGTPHDDELGAKNIDLTTDTNNAELSSGLVS